MEGVAAHVEVGDRLAWGIQLEAAEAVLLAPDHCGVVRIRCEVAPLDGQSPESWPGDPFEVARAGEDGLASQLVRGGLGILRLHENVLEEGGGLVVRQLAEDRLREVGGDHGELSSCSLVSPARFNGREVLAGRGRVSLWIRTKAATCLGSSLVRSPLLTSHGNAPSREGARGPGLTVKPVAETSPKQQK